MKKANWIYLAILTGSISIYSCGSSNSNQDNNSTDKQLTPVTEPDNQRYNINKETETVINLDSTKLDTTSLK